MTGRVVAEPGVAVDAEAILSIARCPRCGACVRRVEEGLQCEGCKAIYLVVDGVPILIDEERSGVQIRDVIERASTSRRRYGWLLPEPTLNVAARRNYRSLAHLLVASRAPALVLVVGGRIVGNGVEELLQRADIELVETDIALGPRTRVACDGHVLPFADGVFDGVILQAVLEHVRDPWRCVAEAYRVLRPGGLVYAETPFMQQMHADQDFTRFTFSGHRLLLEEFEEVDAGVAVGPATALAWAWEHFVGSFAVSMQGRRAALVVGRLTGFWLKYFDLLLANRPNAFRSASCFYFLGRKPINEARPEEAVR